MRDDHFLILTQWLSPAYPVGAFAWSHGLERAINRGDVRNAADFSDWLTTVLEQGAGRSDAILLCAAHATQDVEAFADLAAALAPSEERRMEIMQQGHAFAATTREVWGIDLPDLASSGSWPRRGRSWLARDPNSAVLVAVPRKQSGASSAATDAIGAD